MGQIIKPPHPPREIRDEKFKNGLHYCTKCKTFLPVSEFNKNNSEHYGLCLWCKTCLIPYHRKLAKRRAGFYKKRNSGLREKYLNLFGKKCNKCGYSKSSCALEFHHLEEKKYNPTQVICFSDEQIALAELDKCILLCSNCHREIGNGIWDAEFVKEKLGYSIGKIKFDSSQ